jgi:membrane-associated protein
MMTRPKISLAIRWAAGLLLLVAVVAVLVFGFRTFNSFIVLRSAYHLGEPSVSSVRAWMTLGYVSTTYGAPAADLLDSLGLPADIPLDTTLATIADDRHVARIDFVRRVQGAIVAVAPADVPADASTGSETSGSLTEGTLSALLLYSYPAMAAVFLLGAIGAPLPTGFAAVLAGSLAASGRLSWLLAGAIAVVASSVGDIVDYGVGRVAHERFVARHGRFFGYSEARRARVQALFDRWGGVTVLLTRTLVSHLSPLASLLAGISRYRFAAFLAFAIVGRVLWTGAYIGLGYYFGHDLDAASGFLANLTGLLISAGIGAAMVVFLVRGRQPSEAAKPT